MCGSMGPSIMVHSGTATMVQYYIVISRQTSSCCRVITATWSVFGALPPEAGRKGRTARPELPQLQASNFPTLTTHLASPPSVLQKVNLAHFGFVHRSSIHFGYECASTNSARRRISHQTSYVTTSEQKPSISNISLTDTEDWAVHLVTAALKCTTDDRASSTYLTADEAKHDILRTLNWFEANNEYEWPHFSAHFSFDQVMRLRRVLVTDVYTTLERVGHIELGALRTPDSSDGGVRRGRARDGKP